LVKENQWRHVQFDVGDANSVPEQAGVYVICTYPPGQRRSVTLQANNLFATLFTAIYVGKSLNLKQRFRQHCQSTKAEIQDSRECFADGLEFWFIKLEPNVIASIEALLIDCLGPPANSIRGSINATIQDPIPA